MMPYYSRPIGTAYAEVGFSFNKGIVTDLLRNQLGFDGIVVSDWGLITDTVIRGQDSKWIFKAILFQHTLITWIRQCQQGPGE